MLSIQREENYVISKEIHPWFRVSYSIIKHHPKTWKISLNLKSNDRISISGSDEVSCGNPAKSTKKAK